MATLIQGRWERCPDGVELFDYGPERRVPGVSLLSQPPYGKRLRYRTDERVEVIRELERPSDPIVMELANAPAVFRVALEQPANGEPVEYDVGAGQNHQDGPERLDEREGLAQQANH